MTHDTASAITLAFMSQPHYPEALEAFREQAAVPRALPVGLASLSAMARRYRATLACVISTFHNPTGPCRHRWLGRPWRRPRQPLEIGWVRRPNR